VTWAWSERFNINLTNDDTTEKDGNIRNIIFTFVPCILILLKFLFTNECTSDCLKNIKIYIKIAPTCFCAVTPSSGSALFVLAKVTLVKIVSYGTSVCDEIGGDVATYISRSLLVRFRTVQHTHTNKDLLICAATSPPI